MILKRGGRYYFKEKQRKHSGNLACLPFMFCFIIFKWVSTESVLPEMTRAVEFRMWRWSRHRGSVFTLPAPAHKFPHTGNQSLNVSPRWWTLSIQKIKVLLYSHFECWRLFSGADTAACDTLQRWAAGWLHIFQISQCTSAGGDHDGRYKYSEGTCCIPSPLILLTFPHGGLNRLSFNLI